MWTLLCFCIHSAQTCLQKILIVSPEGISTGECHRQLCSSHSVGVCQILAREQYRLAMQYDNCTECHLYLGRLSSQIIVIAFLMKSCWEVLCLGNSHSSGLSSNRPSAAHMLCKAIEVIMASEDARNDFCDHILRLFVRPYITKGSRQISEMI